MPFTRATRTWFEASFQEPTPAQSLGWPAIAKGEHTLIHAPTGSGKTLAAFLWTLDRLLSELLLAARKVMVERASGGATLREQLRKSGRGVPLAAEQGRGGGHERGPASIGSGHTLTIL